MKSRDNWGWQGRIGMFIVSSEAVPEAEWWAMMPEGCSVHAARVASSTPWATWRADGSDVDLAADLARGAEQFASMQLSAVVLGHSSSGFVGGTGWDAATVQALSEILGPDIAVTTNGLDSFAALKASGIERPFLVLPPWFNAATVDKGLGYFRDNGVTLSGHLQYDPGPGWCDVPPGDMYRRGMGFAQEIEPLYRQIRAACPDQADGVLIAGTGFRCVGIIDTLERDLGRPVLTANQVSLWNCLRLSGVRARVEGYGRLFTL